MRSPSSDMLSNSCAAPPSTTAEESQPVPTTVPNGSSNATAASTGVALPRSASNAPNLAPSENDHDLAISEQDLAALGLGSLVQDSGSSGSSGGELNLAHLLSDVDRAEHLLDHLDARVDSILKSLDEFVETTSVAPTKQ